MTDRLDERAAESLAFIRTTMARSASFTAVSGVGGAAMGVVACVAGVVAGRQPDRVVWLVTWLIAAAVAAPIGLASMARKARRHGVLLRSASGRRFAQAFLPALVVGAVLTAALARNGQLDLLPAVWLLSYGVGIMAGGAASLPVLGWVGGGFMAFGVAAAFTPVAFGNAWMVAGFGVLQMAFGVLIARNHGG